MQFLDTNVILRYITQDSAEQAERAYRLFQQLQQGALKVTTSEAVIVECVQVLSSKVVYNLPRQDIRTHLSNVLALKGLTIPNKRSYLQALDLYASTNIDFVDALNVAHMQRAGITEILSFDRDFDRVPDVQRVEPS